MTGRIEAIEAIEARNKKLSFTIVDGASVAVLHLNGSADFFRTPRRDLSDIVNKLGLPDHPESSGQPLEIDLTSINEILGIENPTPEQEATLTAVLSGDTTISAGSVNAVSARRITFSSGLTSMVAALFNLPNASATYRLPTRLLIITDRP